MNVESDYAAARTSFPLYLFLYQTSCFVSNVRAIVGGRIDRVLYNIFQLLVLCEVCYKSYQNIEGAYGTYDRRVSKSELFSHSTATTRPEG